MRARLLNFIEKNGLLPEGGSLLLAISGGLDSVVLCHLIHDAGIPFGIAHCNFGLRGQESDEDALFVKTLAEKYTVPIYTKTFQTQKYTEENKLSIQMAARKLRYDWFAEILENEHYDRIATGHHLDDQVETFFINLLRGTGLSGLRGIPALQDNVIRPMLFLNRREIEAYALKNGLTYREDSSNAGVDYERNKIRHQLIPLLTVLQPSLTSIMAETFEKLKEAEEIMLARVNEEKKRLVPDEIPFCIPIDALKALQPVQTYLHYFLKDLGFNTTLIRNLAACLDSTETRIFHAEKYQLTKDRSQVIIESKPDQNKDEKVFRIYLPDGADNETCQFEIDSALRIQMTIERKKDDFVILFDEKTAQIDFDTLSWPLEIRPWRQGDEFRPLGMKGKKKISDYFIDEKYSASEKKDTWILSSGAGIAWIIGKRLSEDYKIKPGTKRILKIELL